MNTKKGIFTGFFLLPVFLLLMCNNGEKGDMYGFTTEEIMLNTLFLVDIDGPTVAYSSTHLEWKKCTQGHSYYETPDGLTVKKDCKGTPLVYDGIYGATTHSYCATDDDACNSLLLPLPVISGSLFDTCDQDTTDGKSDWRVPTPIEMETILTDSRDAFIQVFPDTVNGYYWTSWGSESDNTRAYAYSFQIFDYGIKSSRLKSSGFYVRCVRNWP